MAAVQLCAAAVFTKHKAYMSPTPLTTLEEIGGGDVGEVFVEGLMGVIGATGEGRTGLEMMMMMMEMVSGLT